MHVSTDAAVERAVLRFDAELRRALQRPPRGAGRAHLSPASRRRRAVCVLENGLWWVREVCGDGAPKALEKAPAPGVKGGGAQREPLVKPAPTSRQATPQGRAGAVRAPPPRAGLASLRSASPQRPPPPTPRPAFARKLSVRDAATQVHETLLTTPPCAAVAGAVAAAAVVAVRKLQAARRRGLDQHRRAFARPACPKCEGGRGVRFKQLPNECLRDVFSYLRLGDAEAFALMRTARRFHSIGTDYFSAARHLVLADASAIAHVMNGGLPSATSLTVHLRAQSVAAFRQFLGCARARSERTEHLAVHAAGFVACPDWTAVDVPGARRLEMHAAAPPIDPRFFVRHARLAAVYTYRFCHPVEVLVGQGDLCPDHPLRVLLYGFNHPLRDPGVVLSLRHLRVLGILENAALPLCESLTALVCRAHTAADVLLAVAAFCPAVRTVLVVAPRAGAVEASVLAAAPDGVSVELCPMEKVFRRACQLAGCV
eukprot:TRINITY_DN12432_c0_g1_i4.p1 TRINITY_DN12432_c0_g1~~TRINITY_DN12432_c0_g1_i4.p1  ORF type:complete len:538 (+),score=97.17 TRINITY_DN12432_c0_g1_i4:162-1616(+)